MTESPFNDIRVRQALIMARDLEAVTKAYFRGKAHLFPWPIPNVPGFMATMGNPAKYLWLDLDMKKKM